MISKSLALKVLNEGLSTGADFVEIYIELILVFLLALVFAY